MCRTRLAFLDQRAALGALPKVIELLGKTLSWNEARKQQEKQGAEAYLGHTRTRKLIRH